MRMDGLMSRHFPRDCTIDSTRRGGESMYDVLVLSIIDVIFNNITFISVGALSTIIMLLLLFAKR